MSIESITPRAVFDLYLSLSGEDQRKFLLLLGQSSIAEVPFLITSELPLPERERYSDMVSQEIVGLMLPIMVREARHLARKHPDLSDDEFDELLGRQIAESTERFDSAIGELERAKLKNQRDRKSDPEIVRRNVEICDRRKQDRKRWSIGKLAKVYKLSHRAITLIIRDESKWRRLNQQNAQ